MEDEGAEISNVRRAIDGGAAAVETEGGAIEGPQITLGPGQGVEKPHGAVYGGEAGPPSGNRARHGSFQDLESWISTKRGLSSDY